MNGQGTSRPEISRDETPGGRAVETRRRELVLVVDDDAAVRRALARVLRADGFDVEVFASTVDVLARLPCDRPTCLVLDIRMPTSTGLDLQARLRTAGHDPAIVFVTGYGDVRTSVSAMKAGAVDFLEKPFEHEVLLAAVRRALDRDGATRTLRRERDHLGARYATLTPRERQVLALVAGGLLNKVVADRLGSSEKTVKVHRGRVMMKMGARSLAELVRMAEKLGVDAESAANG